MKILVIFAIFFASASAYEAPIYSLPEWWANRDLDPKAFIQARPSRIIGGQEAAPNQFPYQVGLRLFIQNSENVGLCGGSLVSTSRVVTAAHCVDIVSGLEARMGAHFLNRDEPNQVRRTVPLNGLAWHENYNPRTLANDVGIINLPTPVDLTPSIQVIRLPQGADLNNHFAGSRAVASGWGRFSSANVASEWLRFVAANVMTHTACRIRFPTINEGTICTSGSGDDGTNVGACNGDSGGPLTIQQNGESLLIGIVSFVSGVGCEAGWPTGFARVTAFVPWIQARL